MAKKKKKSQTADKSKFSEKEVSDSLMPKNYQEKVLREENQNQNFIKELEETVKGLWYMSETDAEISVFKGEKANSVTKEALIKQINISSETNIAEKGFEDFFKNLTAIQDWFGDEEKETVQKFSKLKDLLQKNLRDLKVFKIGQIEIDIYVVGLDANSVLTGVKTKAVET